MVRAVGNSKKCKQNIVYYYTKQQVKCDIIVNNPEFIIYQQMPGPLFIRSRILPIGALTDIMLSSTIII